MRTGTAPQPENFAGKLWAARWNIFGCSGLFRGRRYLDRSNETIELKNRKQACAKSEFALRESNDRAGPVHKKTPAVNRGFMIEAWRFPTFTWQTATLSSALSGFTSEVGMGSGGTRSLWSPGKSVVDRPGFVPGFHRTGSGYRFAAGPYWKIVHARMSLLPMQNAWVLYGQASRAISTG